MSYRNCPECKGISTMESFMTSGGDMPDTPDVVYYVCKKCGCRLKEDRRLSCWVIDIYKHGSAIQRKL